MAMLFLLFALGMSMFFFSSSTDKAKDVVAIMGSVTGILGTLVGYVAGSSGKDKAEQRAAKAEQKVAAVVEQGTAGHSMLQDARTAFPELFDN